MKKQKIYLETTIFNYYFDTNRGIMHAATVKLFDEIKAGKYEPYTSDHVVEELLEASEPKQSEMLDLIKRYNVTVLPENSEATRLADLYVAEGIIPKKYSTDALHIAITTVNDLVWELAERGILSDKALWLKKLEEDSNSYWLARKTVAFLRNKGI